MGQLLFLLFLLNNGEKRVEEKAILIKGVKCCKRCLYKAAWAKMGYNYKGRHIVLRGIKGA